MAGLLSPHQSTKFCQCLEYRELVPGAHASSRPDIIYSSARSTVLFSSTILVASMRISVEVEGCMTAAPSLGLGSIFEPLV